MNASDIRTLFEYNQWANARITRALALVSVEQFLAPNTSSYGSLRGTLYHCMMAEMVWRVRLQQLSVKWPAETDFPTPQALIDAWNAEQALMQQYLAGLTDEIVLSVLDYKNSRGDEFHDAVWHILMHVLNHGTQHRAEAAAMLTDFDFSPGDVDMILFFREKGNS